MTKRRTMKIVDLGSAKPDDPIYSSGPMVTFRPPAPPQPTADHYRAWLETMDASKPKPEGPQS